MDQPDLADTLRRWQESGAVWRVLARTRDGATVGLFTCDGGEEVDRLTSGEPGFLAFLSGRSSSED